MNQAHRGNDSLFSQSQYEEPTVYGNRVGPYKVNH